MIKISGTKVAFTERECLYLAIYPYCGSGQTPPPSHTQIDNPISYLATDLAIMNQRVLSHYGLLDNKVNRDSVKELKQYCANGICPEDEVKWLYSATHFELLFIDSEINQLINQLSQPNPYSVVTTSILYRSDFDPILIPWITEQLVTRIILLMDLCIISTTEGKITFLKNLKQNAQIAKGKISGILRLKNGVEKELTSEFTHWIHNYQNKFFQEKGVPQTFFTQYPETDKYTLDMALANGMITAMQNPAFYDLYEMKVKNAWSQKKHKIKNIEKVARNYNFSRETIEMLNELAKHRGRSKTEVLELLIKEAHEHKKTS